jgi:allantoicase
LSPIFIDGGVKRLRIIGRRELPKNTNDSVAQSATHASKISLARITATPLTYASYSPYGHVIQSFPEYSSAFQNCISVSHSIKVTSANQGTARKYNNIAPVINFRQSNIQSQTSNSDNSTSNKTHIIAKAEPNLSLYKCSPAKSLPFILRLMERHPYSSQMFVPLNNGKVKGYLVVVCLSNDKGDRPDLSTLNAFVVSSNQGISYHPGIWHHPMIALEEVSYTIFIFV